MAPRERVRIAKHTSRYKRRQVDLSVWGRAVWLPCYLFKISATVSGGSLWGHRDFSDNLELKCMEFFIPKLFCQVL